MRSPSNRKLIEQMKCSVCLSNPPNDCHHWRSRGAGGTDMLANLVSLCRKHHTQFHTEGRQTFFKKYGERINKFRKLKNLPELDG